MGQENKTVQITLVPILGKGITNEKIFLFFFRYYHPKVNASL